VREPNTPIALAAGEGERLGTSVIKVARPELSLLELEIEPGGSVQPHFHKEHSDSFFILEGELEIHVGDKVVTAVPGTYALAPPGVVHFFRNVSARPSASSTCTHPVGSPSTASSSRLSTRGEKNQTKHSSSATTSSTSTDHLAQDRAKISEGDRFATAALLLSQVVTVRP